MNFLCFIYFMFYFLLWNTRGDISDIFMQFFSKYSLLCCIENNSIRVWNDMRVSKKLIVNCTFKLCLMSCEDQGWAKIWIEVHELEFEFNWLHLKHYEYEFE